MINPPHRRHAASGVRRHAPSGVPVANRRVKVVNAETGESLGYLTKNLNIFGETGVTKDEDNYFTTSFTPNTDGSPFDISSGDDTYPFLGLIEDFANTSPDLAAGSFNYLYLGHTSQTTPGAGPTTESNSFTAATTIEKTIQSAVWTYD